MNLQRVHDHDAIKCQVLFRSDYVASNEREVWYAMGVVLSRDHAPSESVLVQYASYQSNNVSITCRYCSLEYRVLYNLTTCYDIRECNNRYT